MAIYRQIHVKIWSSPDFQEVSSFAKFIFIYLFSNSHRNEAALYRITPKTISNETDIPVDYVMKSLQELDDTGLIKYDKSEYIVWVINAVRYQTIGPNMVKAILKDIEGIEHSFCEDFKRYYQEILNSFGTLPEPFRNPSGTLPDKGKGNININSNINNNPPISPQGEEVLGLIFEEQQTDTDKKAEKSATTYTLEFEEFWSIYPRQKEKQAAFKRWKARLNEGHQPRELIEAARLYADDCRRQGTQEQFIKQAKTFIGCNKPFIDYKEVDKSANEFKPYRGDNPEEFRPYRG